MVGRPVAWGLAEAGALGVAHVLRLLRDELRIAMAIAGCRSPRDIGPSLIFRQNPPEGCLTASSQAK